MIIVTWTLNAPGNAVPSTRQLFKWFLGTQHVAGLLPSHSSVPAMRALQVFSHLDSPRPPVAY